MKEGRSHKELKISKKTKEVVNRYWTKGGGLTTGGAPRQAKERWTRTHRRKKKKISAYNSTGKLGIVEKSSAARQSLAKFSRAE